MRKACPVFIFSSFIFLIFLSRKVFAQVVINEFSSNSDPEWVEIYNKGGQIVDLTGWMIVDGNSSLTDDLNLNGCIKTNDFRSFSRSKGWLNDTGDSIYLKDNVNNIVDQVSYGSSGIVGIPPDGKSAGRSPPGNSTWVIFDSPGKTDTECLVSPTQTPTLIPTGTATNTLTPTPTLLPIPTHVPTTTLTPIPILSFTPTPVSYQNIIINEFLADPVLGNEKVEIKNNNNFSVTLSDWKIDDIENGGKLPIKFSADIQQFGLFVKDLGPASFLNNDADQVRLLDPQGVEKDRKDYAQSAVGLSWRRDNNGNWCMGEPSFGTSNPDCPQPTSIAPTPTPVLLPTVTIVKTPTPATSLKNTITPTVKKVLSPTTGVVLGEDFSDPSSNIVLISEKENPVSVTGNLKPKNKTNKLFLIPIIGGTIMVGISLFFMVKNKSI